MVMWMVYPITYNVLFVSEFKTMNQLKVQSADLRMPTQQHIVRAAVFKCSQFCFVACCGTVKEISNMERPKENNLKLM